MDHSHERANSKPAITPKTNANRHPCIGTYMVALAVVLALHGETHVS